MTIQYKKVSHYPSSDQIRAVFVFFECSTYSAHESLVNEEFAVEKYDRCYQLEYTNSPVKLLQLLRSVSTRACQKYELCNRRKHVDRKEVMVQNRPVIDKLPSHMQAVWWVIDQCMNAANKAGQVESQMKTKYGEHLPSFGEPAQAKDDRILVDVWVITILKFLVSKVIIHAYWFRVDLCSLH